MISEKALKEINKALHIGDVMLRFKLRLNIEEWGNYKKGDGKMTEKYLNTMM